MNYNLQKNDLYRLPEYINFAREEEITLNYWKANKIFAKSQKLSEGKPKYTFYDGPPFATGLPHYGHILAGTIKDIVTRYAYQKGNHVERRFGWDCHGLPVEYEIDNKLGIRSSYDVERLGIAKYNNECREIVMRYAKEWKETTERFGRWIDFENDYKTLYPWYMETIWWVFNQLFVKGLIYRGVKVMPFSTACRTPISNFEAGQNYKEVNDPSVVVKLNLMEEDASFLVWTTTPWTLPANLAVCVHPNFEYVKIKEVKSGEVYIVAECRLGFLFKSKLDYEIIEKYSGKGLKDKKYVPLFPYFEKYGSKYNAFRVLVDDYVTDDTGTGIVHQAPFFGEDDFRVCLAAKIIRKGGEVICPVDESGKFTNVVSDFYGKYIKAADKEIISNIKSRKKLFQESQIKHRYPYCWRSDTPLIYKAVQSWFVRVEHMTEDLLKANEITRWVPDYVKDKRFANWLKDAKDWAVSRNRFWGTPIPIWISEDDDEIVCIGSIKELEKLSGKKICDLHRDSIDNIEIPSTIPGKPPLRRIKEVFDCWFESGSMPFAQQHYPFENVEKFLQSFPANFIAEGIDQTRGWFYTLLVISTALFNKAPYKNLIVNGLVLAADGQKMSKRKKNYPNPLDVINAHGADALRLYLINSPVVKGENLRFKIEGVRNIIKDVFLPWYNSLRFFIQNSNRLEKEDKLEYWYDKRRHEKNIQQAPLLDIWIISAKESLIKFVAEEMNLYRLYTILPRLLVFLDHFSNWYIRLNKSTIKGECGVERCLMSLDTLYDVLISMTKLMAPFIPFLSEYFYQRLKFFSKESYTESVHFQPLPSVNPHIIRKDIEESVSMMQSIIEMGRAIRDKRCLAIKYPVAEVNIISYNKKYLEDMKSFEDFIIKELNAKHVTFSSDRQKYNITVRAEPDYKVLGQRLKEKLEPVTRELKNLSDSDIQICLKNKCFNISGFHIDPSEIRLIHTTNMKEGKDFGVDGDDIFTILIDFTPSQQFEEEGTAREIINRVQKMKKKAKLLPTDQTCTFFSINNIDSSHLCEIFLKYKNMIENTIKSSFEKLSEIKTNFIIEEDFILKGIKIKITICSKIQTIPVIPWANVQLQENIKGRYTIGRKGSVILQKIDGTYLSLEELRNEIIQIFGLYGLNFMMYCTEKVLDDVRKADGRLIIVSTGDNDVTSSVERNEHPFSRFINCEFQERKFTVFLENPFNCTQAENLHNILKRVYPTACKDEIVFTN